MHEGPRGHSEICHGAERHCATDGGGAHRCSASFARPSSASTCTGSCPCNCRETASSGQREAWSCWCPCSCGGACSRPSTRSRTRSHHRCRVRISSW
jgi:hypothetical protein